MTPHYRDCDNYAALYRVACICSAIESAFKRGYRQGYNEAVAARQHWQDTHGAYRQHGEGENP